MSHRMYQIEYHGEFVGYVTDDGLSLRFQATKYGATATALEGRTFPSEAALRTALDTLYSPHERQQMDAEQAARQQRRADEQALAEQWAVERTFTGERYDEGRPMREVARLLLADLKAAAKAGTLPPDTYRVTVKSERWTATPTLTIWSRHHATHDEVLRTLARRYNKVVGRWLSLYETDDSTAFDVTLDSNKAQWSEEDKAQWVTWQARKAQQRGK